MTTITIKENIKLSNNWIYDNLESFFEDFVKNNYTDSNINSEYEIAYNMQNAWLPDTFIKNFVKSYE